MYDTLHIWMERDEAGMDNLTGFIPSILSNATEHRRPDGKYYITGTLPDNLKVGISDIGISIKGSLAKYYLNDNIKTLNRGDCQRAVEKLSDELHLAINEAKLTRIDFANNNIMTYPPEAYYDFLGNSQYYNRFQQPNSLYYSNGLRTKLFYNKIEESKKKGIKIPEIWQGQNILRYEYRLTGRVSSQLNIDKVKVKHLHNEDFYMGMVDRWISEYEAINKLNLIQFSMDNIKTPKDFFNQILALKMKEIGEPSLYKMIEGMKARRVFNKPEYYCRLKNEVRDFCKKPDISTSSELIEELNKKIFAVKRYYR